MKLKPSKCRSFSIQGGKPGKINFYMGDKIVPSIADEEQKFLGKLLFFTGKAAECYELLKESLKVRLENLDLTSVRPDFKVETYKIYILPSIRFLLSVHNLPVTYETVISKFSNYSGDLQFFGDLQNFGLANSGDKI